MTKREILTRLLAMTNGEALAASDLTDIAAYATAEMKAIDAKNAKASERRVNASAANRSALTASILETLTDTPTLLSDIANQMGTSTNKIQGLLSEMAKAGTVVRTEVKVGKNKKVAYHVA